MNSSLNSVFMSQYLCKRVNYLLKTKKTGMTFLKRTFTFLAFAQGKLDNFALNDHPSVT